VADITPERAYRPIDAESNGGPRVLLRALVPIVFVASAAVLFAPSLLRFVLPDWQGGPAAETYARVIAFAALALTLTVSAVSDSLVLQRKQRETWNAFAQEVGGAVSVAPLRPTAGGGWEGGLRVAYTMEGRPVVLTCYGPKSSNRYARLGATLPLGRDVQFQILANTTANRILMSSAIWTPVLALASREAGKGPEGAESTRALDRMRFLTAAPLVTGDASFDHAFLLKATDEGIGRDVAGDPSVRTALERLAKRDRYFRLSLVGLTAPGPAQLEVELVGRLADVERLRAMHELLLAVMARLDRSGVLETGARRAS
jgi:hypothetical protein